MNKISINAEQQRYVIDCDVGYREADMSINPSTDAERPWKVLRREEIVASIRDIGQAGAYLAFMRGATIEPHIFR